MDAIDSVVDPLREFAKDSVRLVKRCHKPDRKGRERLASSRLVSSLPLARFPPRSDEFSKVALRTAIGFVVMGFVGFFVKLIFIPINNIIVGLDAKERLAWGYSGVLIKEKTEDY
uniref:Protein transport protein Sec61 subunit gamma n=2 Tax=Oryza TaxID=4527 RepID=A0A0D3GJE5_9ORYZ